MSWKLHIIPKKVNGPSNELISIVTQVEEDMKKKEKFILQISFIMVQPWNKEVKGVMG